MTNTDESKYRIPRKLRLRMQGKSRRQILDMATRNKRKMEKEKYQATSIEYISRMWFGVTFFPEMNQYQLEWGRFEWNLRNCSPTHNEDDRLDFIEALAKYREDQAALQVEDKLQA